MAGNTGKNHRDGAVKKEPNLNGQELNQSEV